LTEHLSTTFDVGTDKYKIDRYAAKTGAAKRPVVVILHGVDGMIGESETEIRKLAEQIAGDGYLVFLPHYLVATGDTTPMPSPELLVELLVQRTAQVNRYRPRIAAAVDHALKQPDADAMRLGIVGLSLGGGLALWYAETAAAGKVKAVVDFFGHVSDPSIYGNAGKLPPTLVFHNDDDGVVDPKHSVDLLAALKKKGVTHEGHFYTEPYPERRNHNFRPGGPADVDSRARTRKWLETHVK